MKPSWTTILLITGLAGLLALLGVLQYQWLNQINESEGEKAHKRVQEQADRFAADFNREIQNAYFNFQTDSDAWRTRDWTEFNQRFDFWKEKTAYPSLIDEFYFFEAKPDAAPMIFDRVDRAFIPTELTPELEAIRARSVDESTFKAVDESSLSLILPIHKIGHNSKQMLILRRGPEKAEPMQMPPKFGYLVIKLDRETLVKNLLTDLVTKYYPGDEYRVSIADKTGSSVFGITKGGERDATAQLFDMSPENFIFFANKDLMKSVEGRKRQSVVLDSRVESRTFERKPDDGDNNTALKVEIRKDALPRTSVFTASTTNTGSGDSPWTLGVQHSSGSLNAFMASTLRRNLAVGFGILMLLAAAVLAIIISAQRAKMHARRQVEFVSSVSHEFRTPIAVICSAGENLADGVAKEDGQVSRYGDLIKGEGRKLSGMVEQILDFAGANSGRKKYSFADIAMNDVLEDALNECRPLVDDKNVELVVQMAKPATRINADKAALSQAVQNLIANSVKYSNGSPWLRLSAGNGDGKIRITVEDRGLGISKSDLRQIFEPFFRSKQVVDAQIHGNGLGLSLVRQIITAHGGRVTVESEVGKGSKFTIELPGQKMSEPPA